ncbi:MFS transporter [Gammaproteobacteria bacterium]|nr:MFS transporter [Gammaproteobacteria bacterium]
MSCRRIQTIFILGISSGLPLALTSSSLQAWFTSEGVDLVTIGFLTLLGLPYVWKFLWAPVLDRFLPPFLSRRKGWILISQAFLCLLILIMSRLSPSTQPSLISLVALSVAFMSATQDIGSDAYRADLLSPNERGMGAASATLGFRVAMLISGGLALIMADHIGWKLTYEIMASLIGLSMIVTFFAPREPKCEYKPQKFINFIVEPFYDLLSKDKILIIILFIITYKLGDALALSLMSNFLLNSLQFSLTDVGVAFKFFGLIATLLGVLVGGILMVRLSLFSSLMLFGLFQAFSNITFVFLAMIGKNYCLMFSCIFIESFCSGMSTAAFVAFLMSLCNKKFSATQYAFLSALFALSRVFSGPIAAVLVKNIGWINFYLIAFFLSFPGIFLLTALRGNVSVNYAKVNA